MEEKETKTVPHPALENRKTFYIPVKILLCFFFCKISKQPQLASGNSAARSGIPEVISLYFLSEMQNATREGRGRRCQVQCII